jgi:hypothetical protein
VSRFFIAMLSVIMLSVVTLSVVMLSIVMLSVVAPNAPSLRRKYYNCVKVKNTDKHST